MSFPIDEITLNVIKDALTTPWEVDPETGDHYRENGVPSLYQLLEFMSGPEDFSEEEYGDSVMVSNRPTYSTGDLILALIDEIERLRIGV